MGKKTNQILILVSDNDKKKMETNAQRFGLTLSEYIRSMSLRVPLKLDLNPERDADYQIMKNILDESIDLFELKLMETCPLVDVDNKICDFIDGNYNGLFYGSWMNSHIEFDEGKKLYYIKVE